MGILELTIERRDLVDDAARLLHETFLARTADWQNHRVSTFASGSRSPAS
jgi:hypothetical protein